MKQSTGGDSLVFLPHYFPYPGSRQTTERRTITVPGWLVAATIGTLMIVLPALITAQAHLHNQTSPGIANSSASPECPSNAKIDLAFILDRSGSMAPDNRGQTYNVQIEGVRRALLDPTVIPRDGTVAVTVLTFAEKPTIQVQFKEIKSEKDAVDLAAAVEALKCDSCPALDTDFGMAIKAANDYLNQNQSEGRKGARRVLLMSTDGGCTDTGCGAVASDQARRSAEASGISSELDVILVGLKMDTDDPESKREFEVNKSNVDRIVFPKPETDLPGKTLVIEAETEAGGCNEPDQTDDNLSDCNRQANEFAQRTRDVLLGERSMLTRKVTTADDTEVGAPPSDQTLSLRQAIEQANNRGGNTTITFDPSLNGKTIFPLVPLPALTAPGITICGCAAECPNSPTTGEQKCEPLVIIDGSKTDTTKGECHSDGILIRSNHDVVRGLRIIGFKRAGIAIAPVCPSDMAGKNIIENNKLEDNGEAGVLVLDPPPGQPNNVGNTISRTDIMGSATPIDLGGDGRTANDLCDSDSGPNTLLNFPRITAVVRSANGVMVTGTVCDPNCAEKACPPNLIGAVVEIFAVTEFGTASTSQASSRATNAQDDSNHRNITGVMFLARGVIDANGSFTISNLPDSPTCGYSATFIDGDGNTSELTFPCAGFARAELPTQFEFLKVKPDSGLLSGTFIVENNGCDRLVLNSYSVKREGFKAKKNRGDDSAHFSIGKPPVEGVGPTISINPPIVIDPGQSQTIPVFFNPAIPHILLPEEKRVRAADTLPQTITSRLTFNHNGCGETDMLIKASVSTEVQLINSNRVQPRTPPLATLTKSGDLFEVTIFVFDSNLDVSQGHYEFLDNEGRIVPVDKSETDIASAIKQKDPPLVVGQSFTVIQRFSNANEHPEVARVRVTIEDAENNKDSVTADLMGTLTGTTSIQSLRRPQGTVLLMPIVKLTPASKPASHAPQLHRGIKGRRGKRQ